MEVLSYSETSVLTRATQHHIPENGILYYFSTFKRFKLALISTAVLSVAISWQVKTSYLTPQFLNIYLVRMKCGLQCLDGWLCTLVQVYLRGGGMQGSTFMIKDWANHKTTKRYFQSDCTSLHKSWSTTNYSHCCQNLRFIIMYCIVVDPVTGKKQVHRPWIYMDISSKC